MSKHNVDCYNYLIIMRNLYCFSTLSHILDSFLASAAVTTLGVLAYSHSNGEYVAILINTVESGHSFNFE
jgi:hypothetical protein